MGSIATSLAPSRSSLLAIGNMDNDHRQASPDESKVFSPAYILVCCFTTYAFTATLVFIRDHFPTLTFATSVLEEVAQLLIGRGTTEEHATMMYSICMR